MGKLQLYDHTLHGKSNLPVDEQRKRVFLSLCILFSVPAALVYGLIDWYQGRTTEGALIIGMGAVLVAILFLFRYLTNMVIVYRFSGALVFLLLIYEIAVGGGEGYGFLWFYSYPIALFFIFGRKEGLIWVLASLGPIVLFFFFDFGAYAYSMGVSIRFFVTYAIVSAISYALESSRDHYYSALLLEKRSLEKALSEVKTLSGLLPVCAHCKKIRDDKGYWNQIEAYIEAHSDADFSHGICPECAKKYYPDLNIFPEDTPSPKYSAEQ